MTPGGARPSGYFSNLLIDFRTNIWTYLFIVSRIWSWTLATSIFSSRSCNNWPVPPRWDSMQISPDLTQIIALGEKTLITVYMNSNDLLNLLNFFLTWINIQLSVASLFQCYVYLPTWLKFWLPLHSFLFSRNISTTNQT